MTGGQIDVRAGRGLKFDQGELQPDFDAASVAGKVCEANDPRLSDARLPKEHAATHQYDGSDKINVQNLVGLLADPQKVVAQENGTARGARPVLNFTGDGVRVTNDPINNRFNITIPGGGGTLGPHAATHQNGGTDEINVEGLSGVLESAQKVTLQEDNTLRGTRATLNFTGEGVAVSDDPTGNRVNIAISDVSGDSSVGPGPGVRRGPAVTG